MNPKKLLVFVPTYNERENVTRLYEEIKAQKLGNDFLFLDDGSPDGTGKILDEIRSQDSHVHVIHRKGKEGIGSAHKMGIQFAYDQGYSILITMDCDFTHLPEDIIKFLNNASGYDVVVGSRFMMEGSLEGWNLYRKFMTHFGHFLTRKLLGLPHDATGAFRLYQLGQLRSSLFDEVESMGYSFFFESLYSLMLEGAKMKEIPITLPSRVYGHSKMEIKDIHFSIFRLFVLFAWRLLGRKRAEFPLMKKKERSKRYD